MRKTANQKVKKLEKLYEAYCRCCVQEGDDTANSIMLARNVSLKMDYFKDKHNQLVIGGCGSGRTASFVLPNIMKEKRSFVVIDDSIKTCLAASRQKLTDDGYTIKVLNLQSPASSDHYNPLAHLTNDVRSCLNAAQLIFTNTNALLSRLDKKNSKENEPDLMVEESLLTALLLYAVETKNCSFSYLYNMLVTSDNLNGQYFSTIKNPDSNAIRVFQDFESYEEIRQEKAKNAVKECLQFFISEHITNITCKDDFNLSRLSEEKQAVFIIPSLSKSDKNWTLIPLFIHQCLEHLCSNKSNGDEQGVPVQFYLDDFKSCGRIPSLHHFMKIGAKYNVSIAVLVNSIRLLENLYSSQYCLSWKKICNECSAMLYLGETLDETTAVFLSKVFDRPSNGPVEMNNSTCLVKIRDLPYFCCSKIRPDSY